MLQIRREANIYRHKEDSKRFALGAIKPYYQDPTRCVYDGKNCRYAIRKNDNDLYYTYDVVGRFMINPLQFYYGVNIGRILQQYPDYLIFKQEAVGVLTPAKWDDLQAIHDAIATDDKMWMMIRINELDLFTIKELQTV